MISQLMTRIIHAMRMPVLLVVLACLPVTLRASGNPVDTTIFDSPFEKRVLLAWHDSVKVDPLDLFMALGDPADTSAIREQIDLYLSQFRHSIPNANVRKQLKNLYRTVPRVFLSRYFDNVFFHALFTRGEFNCLTASALYSILLSRLQIPYRIKETTDHVYLIADVGHSGFLLETTLPSHGLYQFDERFKGNYLRYLLERKIISEDEFRSTPLPSLFDKFFSPDESINLPQLAGLQYYNKAVIQYNAREYNSALRSLEKAEILYPCNRVQYLKYATLTNILSNENVQEGINGRYLAKFINQNHTSPTHLKQAMDHFSVLSMELSFNRPDIELYDKYYSEVMSSLDPSVDPTDLGQMYLSFKAYYLYNNYFYPDALFLLGKAFRLNPGNLRTRQMIAECVERYLVDDRNLRLRLDTLEHYLQIFPFLLQDRTIYKFKSYCLGGIVAGYFRDNELTRAQEYLLRFEAFLKESLGMEISQEAVSMAYGEGSSYYIRRQKYDLAESMLQRGLETAPDSHSLHSKLETLRDSKGELSAFMKDRTLRSSSDTYKDALLYAQMNRITIHDNVQKYLLGKWTIVRQVDQGVEKPVAAADHITYTFLEGHKVVMTLPSGESNGTWEYDPVSCTLDLAIDGTSSDLFLLITEINASQMYAYLFHGDDLFDLREVVLKPVKK
jgi:tetratricopeptide (TPR) repeat protein